MGEVKTQRGVLTDRSYIVKMIVSRVRPVPLGRFKFMLTVLLIRTDSDHTSEISVLSSIEGVSVCIASAPIHGVVIIARHNHELKRDSDCCVVPEHELPRSARFHAAGALGRRGLTVSTLT